MRYEYENSLDGLLTAIATALKQREMEPEFVLVGDPQPDLFAASTHVAADPIQAGKLADWISDRLGARAMRSILLAFHAANPAVGRNVHDFIVLGLKRGRSTTKNLTHPCVLALQKLARRVGARRAVLRRHSPSCGCGTIRRGGETVRGHGVTTALLLRAGIEVEPLGPPPEPGKTR